MDARDEALRTSFEEVMSIKITTKTLSSCEQYHPCDSYHATNAVGVNGSREAAFPLPGGEREASEAKQGEGRESLAIPLKVARSSYLSRPLSRSLTRLPSPRRGEGFGLSGTHPPVQGTRLNVRRNLSLGETKSLSATLDSG